MIAIQYRVEKGPLQTNEGLKLSFDTLEDQRYGVTATNSHVNVWCFQIISLEISGPRKIWGDMGPPVGLIIVENEDSIFRRVCVFYTF